MFKSHSRNTVRYYILIVVFLSFLFFSDDFGLLDVQKTAIVMAAGIDREDDTFIVTSQVAIPQSSKQGKASETVQLVSRGKTVADAFEEINAKTGWYPKLVFCKLILLGESAAEQNVFDALEFFLRDEYLTDNCLVATCEGTAYAMLDQSALVDPSTSVAIEKVLSTHAQRVGSVLTTTLREFSIGYFSEGKSGYLPVVKKEERRDGIGENPSQEQNQSGQSQGGSSSGGQSQSQQQGESSGGEQQMDKKPLFSAGETALFVDGKRVGTLSAEETFAFVAVNERLKLASYSVEQEGKTCTFTIKNNGNKIDFSVGEGGRAHLKIEVVMTAGILDFSKALPLQDVADAGDAPKEYLALAERKLKGEIVTVFEKCRKVGCDLFGLKERLAKYEKKKYHPLKDTVLEGAIAEVSVKFRNIR